MPGADDVRGTAPEPRALLRGVGGSLREEDKIQWHGAAKDDAVEEGYRQGLPTRFTQLVTDNIQSYHGDTHLGEQESEDPGLLL